MTQPSGAVYAAPIIPAGAGRRARALLRCLPVALAVGLVALLAGAFAASLVPLRFTAQTSLLLMEGQGLAPVGDRPSVAAAIVASPDFAREAVALLGAETVARLRGDPLDGLPGLVRQWLGEPGGRNGAGRDSEAGLERAFLKALGTRPADDTGILSITMTADDAEAAARAANVVAQVYLDRRRAAVTERDDALRAASLRVAEAQQALQRGLDSAAAFRADPAGGETAQRARTAADDLALLIAERAALLAEQDAIGRRLASVETMGASGDLFRAPSEGANLLSHLVEQRLTLRAELAAERRIREARHWRVRALTARAADLDDQISQAQGSTREWLAGEREHLAARVVELDTAIRLRQAIIAAAHDNRRRQEAMDRDVERARLQLALERERLQDEAARVRDGAGAARVLTPAGSPEAPDRAVPVGVGAGAALVAALVATALFGGGTGRSGRPRGGLAPGAVGAPPPVFTAGEAETAAGPPPAADIAPVASAAPASIPIRAGGSVPPPVAQRPPFASVRVEGAGDDALDALLARLAIAAVPERGRRLLVLGAAPSGRTAAAAGALARRLALQERVIFLDLTLPAAPADVAAAGFADLVEGRASFSEIIVRDPGSRLHRMERGRAIAQSLPAGDAAELALAALDQTYDWVVAAVGADEQGDLSDRLARRADGVVLVAQGDVVDVAAFAAYEALREQGIDNIVVALADA
ncbi:hypothetical protein ACFFJ7_04705 [Pseudochelatococcus lubricantis]|uniref:hypothetical protein n=1 Tax=Pseudochelatococcus lubricantis TaxID=1538102 RepID=UPI0035EBF535